MALSLNRMQALNKARNICARQEKCKADIRKKLYEWKIDPGDHSWIIDQLEKEKFIDEIRFTGFYVRDKFRFNKWGKTKIEYELKVKQIPIEIINSSLDSIDEAEYAETCKSILSQKLKTLKEDKLALCKEKLIRFGYGRGFEPELVFKMAENLLAHDYNPKK